MKPTVWIAAVTIALAFIAALAYRQDIARDYQRVTGRSSVIASPFGDIEFTQGGSGIPVLVIHGSGGGFDQGELIALTVLDNRFQWITPSRFGYLGSTFHKGATFDEQAHAYAHLLNHLNFDKVAVVALSHGAPSALLFALLHPDRVSSLTLISPGVVSSSTQDQARANQKGDTLTTIFKYDPLYWGVSVLFRAQLMKLMGADEGVIANLTSKQRALIDQIIDYMNPVGPRSAGVAFDNRATMPNERISAIRAPVQIFHAKDDTLQIFRNAVFAATTIPGTKLNEYEKGGHLLIAIEYRNIRDAAQKFILLNYELNKEPLTQ